MRREPSVLITSAEVEFGETSAYIFEQPRRGSGVIYGPVSIGYHPDGQAFARGVAHGGEQGIPSERGLTAGEDHAPVAELRSLVDRRQHRIQWKPSLVAWTVYRATLGALSRALESRHQAQRFVTCVVHPAWTMMRDVVLTSRSKAAGASGPVLFASSAEQMVAEILRSLGSGGRVGQLRILDAFPVSQGPQSAGIRAVLSRLREVFLPGASVELFVAPASPVQAEGSIIRNAGFSGGGLGGGGFSGMANFGGFQGFSGGGSALQRPPAAQHVDAMQLSAALGVPVRQL